MKLIDVGKLKVSPFVFDSIIEMRIEKRLNEHETLYVCGIIKDKLQDSPVYDMTDGTNIKCENDGKVYFSGVLQSVKITSVEDIFRLEAYAVSNTILIDTVKHKRSFQDEGQTYQDIVEKVIADNGQKGTVTYNADAKTVENIILQYNETDWELARRLASHTEDVLIPITADNPSFHFGATDEGGAEIETNNFAVSKEFRRFLVGDDDPQKVAEIAKFTVVTDEYLCGLGEKFSLNGTDLRVCHMLITYIDSALTIAYTLTAKDCIDTHKYFNHAITGLVLDGKVTEVKDDTLKLDLADSSIRGVEKVPDDKLKRGVEEDTGERHFFTYATGYSMEKHTGWYVMPEVDDIVQLLFPREDEKFAYAISSLRQEQTDRTGDYLVKYLRTSFGKEIKFDKNEILISALDDTTFIRINEDEQIGIEVITPHPILIRSVESTINIESEDDMTITTEKNLYIEAKESIEMVCKGNVMKFIPSDGIAFSTDKRYEVLSDENMTHDCRKEMGLKSGKDMKLDCGDKLIESAQKKIEVSCSGSSIIMQSKGIDVKGKEIKQN